MSSDATTRDVFMSRIRAGLGRVATSAPPSFAVTGENEALVRRIARDGQLVELFIERARGVGMVVHRTPLAGLPQALEGLPFARRAVGIEDAMLRRVAEQAHKERIDWASGSGLDALYDTDAGITDVLAAIAETGTLVVRSSATTSRGGFLVPPVHIALVRASQMIADMVDLWPLVRPTPTSVVMITGPSKTADIEGILITGVHGPKEVHVVLIEDA